MKNSINIKYAYILLLGLWITPAFSLTGNDPRVDIETNHGVITVQLAVNEAPITVENFLTYMNEDFYDNTLFHRVINGFMIQGGGFSTEFERLETHAPIVLESNSGLSNIRGTISMARTSAPDSASSQFFINTVDNLFLDYQDASRPGYAIFGVVLEGMDVVDSISAQATGVQDVPDSPVIIEAIRPRDGQLSFGVMQSTYSSGDVITVQLEETMPRQIPLDIWIAILPEDGNLLFVTDKGFSLTPGAFITNVSEAVTSHPVFEFTVPPGLTGHFTLFAIFNNPGAGIGDLLHSLRSNIAAKSIDLVQ